MIHHVLSLLVLLCGSPDEPLPVASRIREVAVYPGSALVTRTADLPAGGGRFALQGLPWSMDPSTIRVRCYGADVIALETRERHEPELPNARLQELRDRARGLERDLQALEDERAVHKLVEDYLGRRLQSEEREQAQTPEGDPTSIETWRKNLQFLSEQLLAVRSRQREVGWKVEELNGELKDVRLELGRGESSGGSYLRDVLVEVVSPGARGSVLDVEYSVASAGWQPLYDLRAAADARSVELSYRAQVWQSSGEDWPQVELSLSTARPNLGAQGPEPQPVWLRLVDPRTAEPRKSGDALARVAAGEADWRLESPPPFAEVQDQGLTVRFKLAARETIQSRPQPTTVLVGQERLDVVPEYYAVPELDTNVWLRGKARNTSPWTMLPGQASVYFGADFIGRANLTAVQPGEELTLHLGADPALSVERLPLEDIVKGPGVFGSRATRTQTWRIRVENHGAAAADPEGGATVIVQEGLPRATDDRIRVELARVEPAPADSERWRKAREEEGLLTWELRAPRSGEAIVQYQTRISFPEGMSVVR
ncbi:MAG TPA: mucoidy inhibitor MuiA family protein [Planctomycetota bacterium]|nr:mucoidy inhibitor MuiA family protein [Planctomycetota bacterium]